MFVARGPSPDCDLAGMKSVHGRSGLNVVRLTGRFSGRRLRPGVYSIIVLAQRGSHRVRLGRIAAQVVPGRKLLRPVASAPAFRCTAARSGGGAELSGLVSLLPAGARFEPPGPGRPPSRGGVLAVPPLNIAGGSGGFPHGLLALIFYASLAVVGSVVLVYAVRYLRDTWSP